MQSLRKFSKLAGVSPATVSRVFSNSQSISPETSKRVRELAKATGFRPSAVGRVAFGGCTRSIGVLLPDLSNSFFNEIAIGLQRHLLNDDYLPMVLQLDENTERRAVQRLLDHRVDALVIHLIDEGLTPEDFVAVLKADLPLVLLGEVHAGLTAADFITNDDVQGGRLVGEHLVKLGHRRFGFCYFGAGHSASDRRLLGFRGELGRNGILLRDEDITRLPTRGGHFHDQHRAQVREALARPQRPTAFFASTDYLAADVYAVAHELHLQIPRDLSVVGYADLNFASLLAPQLTSVRQDGQEIGRRAANMVLERLATARRHRQQITVPTALVVRSSTAKGPPGSV